jgi:hypothetical protein
MSDGYLYGEDAPVEKCPYCGAFCDADFVDVGVGFTQCGPYHCEQCGASEIGPYYEENGPLERITEAERKIDWYAPGETPSPLANVIGGKIVSHRVMKETYEKEFGGNPLWETEGYVKNWLKEIRKPKSNS